MEQTKDLRSTSAKSVQAQCAAAIKAELKQVWPDTKFQVKSRKDSTQNSVDIYWTAGPTQKEVDDLVLKYRCGRYNGQTNSFIFSHIRQDIPQTMYIFTQRMDKQY